MNWKPFVDYLAFDESSGSRFSDVWCFGWWWWCFQDEHLATKLTELVQWMEHTHTQIHTYTCVYIYILFTMWTYIHTCMQTYIHTLHYITYIHTYIFGHIHTHVYIYNMCVCVCLSVCVRYRKCRFNVDDVYRSALLFFCAVLALIGPASPGGAQLAVGGASQAGRSWGNDFGALEGDTRNQEDFQDDFQDESIKMIQDFVVHHWPGSCHNQSDAEAPDWTAALQGGGQQFSNSTLHFFFVAKWVWVKIRYPNNWMVNTKLD